MKTKILLITVVALTYFSTAHAMKAMVAEGGRVGNGGGLVVCRDNTSGIKSVELLDYYEARTQRGFKLELSSLSGDWKAQTQQLIDRLTTLSPLRQQIYSEWLKRFENDARFLKEVQFSTVADTGHIAVPAGCEFEQGVIQTQPRFESDKRYFVNDELWQKMDSSQRAGLILHEFLYREALGYGHEDSLSVRYLSGFIANDAFKTVPLKQWVKTLREARYEMTDYPMPGLDARIKLNLESIWKPAPDEKMLEITLDHRIPLYLGSCKGSGCEKFIKNIASPIINDETLKHYDLHPIAGRVIYADTDIIRLSESDRKTVLRLGINQEQKTLEVEEKNFLETPAISSVFLLKTANSSIVATRATFGRAGETPIFLQEALSPSFKIKTLEAKPDFCKLYLVSLDVRGTAWRVFYQEEQQPALDLMTGAQCKTNANGTLINTLPNVVLELTLNFVNHNSFAFFDYFTGYYSSGPAVISKMTFPNALYQCSSLNGCMNAENGMRANERSSIEVFSSSQVILKVNGTFSNYQIGAQKIEMNAQGIPQSLVISSGSTLSFDENGNVKL